MAELRVSGLEEESIVDGPGLRFVVFTQGCLQRCPGCHNPETQALAGGRLVDTGDIFAQFRENPLLAGMTISGGEPFLQPAALCALAEQVRDAGKNFIVFTGYLCEDLARDPNPEIRRLLRLTDLLIDGPYRQELRSLNLDYRGSSNQRLLTRDAIMATLQKLGSAPDEPCPISIKPAPLFGAQCL